jgi:DNA-binding NarL/FixJ family response regulator
MKVLLADDHELVRAQMRALLGELADFELVAETGDGNEALRLIGEKKPDLALIDLSMPGLNGLEVAAEVKARHPGTRVVIASMHSDEEYVRRARVAGAAGYLLKSADPEELKGALRAIARGESWFIPAVRAR